MRRREFLTNPVISASGELSLWFTKKYDVRAYWAKDFEALLELVDEGVSFKA